MKICAKCVLPETFPGIWFNGDGTCLYCSRFKGTKHLKRQKDEYRKKFRALLGNLDPSRSCYDILVAYSGGKDSTFTLDILKNRFKLKALALTFDHGFVSSYAISNIRNVVETLGIDHITFKPDFQSIKKIFSFSIENEFHPPKALKRASSICNSCMGMVKFIALRTAIEKGIPLIAYGWSPGQAPMHSAIVKNHPSFVRKSQELFLRPLKDAVGPEVENYFLTPFHFELAEKNGLPYNINPLAFVNYDEVWIHERIRTLGWKSPEDTDPNSTNCLLNSFATVVHIEKHGFHPYAMEMAELVREGLITREDALNRLNALPNQNVVNTVRQKLGLH